MKHEFVIEHKSTMKNREKGLTLVELIVAIGVFAIIMLALSGTIVNGLQARRKNNAQAQAVAHANAIIEAYKSDWSQTTRYNGYDPDDSTTFPGKLPPSTGLPFPASGISTNAELCARYDAGTETFISYPDKYTCKAKKGGDIRFVTVIINDEHGKQLVKLEAEIGKPVL